MKIRKSLPFQSASIGWTVSMFSSSVWFCSFVFNTELIIRYVLIGGALRIFLDFGIYFVNSSFYPGNPIQRSHPGYVREDENKQLELIVI